MIKSVFFWGLKNIYYFSIDYIKFNIINNNMISLFIFEFISIIND
jgi:hypothetical protein